MKKQLNEELGLDEDGLPKDKSEDIQSDAFTEKIKRLNTEFVDDYDIDPSMFHVFSKDYMRVDVGLMIQRPPIFLRMREKEISFLKER
jgi:hypothetical protein